MSPSDLRPKATRSAAYPSVRRRLVPMDRSRQGRLPLPCRERSTATGRGGGAGPACCWVAGLDVEANCRRARSCWWLNDHYGPTDILLGTQLKHSTRYGESV